jgi:hypothetical protein
MSVSLTPQQVAAINDRIVARCSTIEVRRWDPTTGRTIEVSQLDRTRLIETVKIRPGGDVTVLT